MSNANKIHNVYWPRTLYEFINQYPQYLQLGLWPMVQKLGHLGYLNLVGQANVPTGQLWLKNQYFSQPGLELEEADMAYGTFDFIVLGFPYIRRHFIESVRPVYVEHVDGLEEPGTGFILENRRFVTCRHCIEDMENVKLDGWTPSNAPLLSIWTSTDRRVDLAILEFASDPFPGVPGFQMKQAEILDDILTMGYPPIKGFYSVLVAEAAQVAGYLQATTGEVVGNEVAYLDGQPYLLITARVKGGNSGGPVISHEGKVVGIVAQLPAGDSGPDTLGYAAVIPITTLEALLQACDNQPEQAQRLPFTPTEDGFRTTKSARLS